MSGAECRAVGAYVRSTDPDMFDQIADYIGSRALAKVGAYVSESDPDRYADIIEVNA